MFCSDVRIFLPSIKTEKYSESCNKFGGAGVQDLVYGSRSTDDAIGSVATVL